MHTRSFREISCRPADDIQVGDRTIQGLLIASADAAFLQTLNGSETIISLVCPDRKTVRTRAVLLLQRMVRVPYSEDWYVSITATGPLFTKGA